MCPNDTKTSLHQPLLFNRNESLFDNEDGSDVTFLVGPESWRFPGHKAILAEANPVFKVMLHQPYSETIITIPDIDGRAFEHLIRYLYNEEVQIQSVSTALATLYAAQKYLCPGLMEQCILYLGGNLEPANVLQIYEDLRVHSGQKEGPSAPPYEALIVPQYNHDPKDNFYTVLTLCSDLANNCLLFIDTHAEEILTQESVEDLMADTLRFILDRDSLDAPETLVYSVVERWGYRECKRCQLELTPDNLRQVVGEDLLFTPRFLRMTSKEFIGGPMSGFILTNNESRTLLCYIEHIPVTNSVDSLTKELLEKLKRKRTPPKDGWTPLHMKKTPQGKKQKDSQSMTQQLKKEKEEKKKESPKRKCTGSCVAEYAVRALDWLFG